MRSKWSPHPIDRAALFCASMLVPGPQRVSWLRDWTSELWYVRRPEAGYGRSLGDATGQSGEGSLRVWLQGQRTAAAFVLGSFRDAVALRRETPEAGAGLHGFNAPVNVGGSATRCATTLMLLTGVTFAAALMLPEARKTLNAASPLSRSLFLIGRAGRAEATSPEIRFSEVRLWRNRSQHLFDGFAFYQPTLKPMHIGPHIVPELRVARGTANLFELLEAKIHLAPVAGVSGEPRLILSEHLWRTSFGGDPGVFGRSIRLGLRSVVLAGYLADGGWHLPGQFDAWVLERDEESDGAVGALPGNARGFAVATLLASPEHARFGGQWSFTVPEADGGHTLFECISPALLAPQPMHIFFFTALLALLALPATTSLSLGEYTEQTCRLTARARLRRWLFLGTKLALLTPTVYFASLDLAYGLPNLSSNQHQYIQIVSSFSLALFGLRWTLRDQRRRCPVCLSVLTNPARVGQPSRNFLSWNGLELICSGGHGLLHVPELPTSWFQTQRWLYLDASWSSLFVATAAAEMK